MSKTYKLKEGDTAREIEIELLSNGRVITDLPDSAVLRIDTGSEVIERTLTDEGDGLYSYKFEAGDFTDLPASATPYTFEVVATYSDGAQGTFPTNGTGKIIVHAAL